MGSLWKAFIWSSFLCKCSAIGTFFPISWSLIWNLWEFQAKPRTLVIFQSTFQCYERKEKQHLKIAQRPVLLEGRINVVFPAESE